MRCLFGDPHFLNAMKVRVFFLVKALIMKSVGHDGRSITGHQHSQTVLTTLGRLSNEGTLLCMLERNRVKFKIVSR